MLMNKSIIESQNFKGTAYASNGLDKADYENCTFLNCVFANADLTGISFIDCKFIDCNFSMAKVTGTAFRDVSFKNCKLLGLHFDTCNQFLMSFQFNECVMNLSSFYRLKIKSTKFNACDLQEADFTEADLTNVSFINCDLNNATFDNTILERADLRLARNFVIDPERNHIEKAKFSLDGVVGLLHKYNIEIEGA
jgi:uncharacterized protein YjbI with pentapeptide repeats